MSIHIMQQDTISTLTGSSYPYESVHQSKIEGYFGDNLLRQLSESEERLIQNLDLFVVMFSNRSGSNYLTGLMNKAGLPIPSNSEPLNYDTVIEISEAYQRTTFADYFMGYIQGWHSENLVGLKAAPRQLFWLQRIGLLSAFRSINIIQCKRDDRLAQAISLYIALNTGKWHSDMATGAEEAVPYSHEGILECLSSICESEQMSDFYNAVHNNSRIQVVYEHLEKYPREELEKVCAFLPGGRSLSMDFEPQDVAVRKQSSSLNCAFRSRFELTFH